MPGKLALFVLLLLGAVFACLVGGVIVAISPLPPARASFVFLGLTNDLSGERGTFAITNLGKAKLSINSGTIESGRQPSETSTDNTLVFSTPVYSRLEPGNWEILSYYLPQHQERWRMTLKVLPELSMPRRFGMWIVQRLDQAGFHTLTKREPPLIQLIHTQWTTNAPDTGIPPATSASTRQP